MPSMQSQVFSSLHSSITTMKPHLGSLSQTLLSFGLASLWEMTRYSGIRREGSFTDSTRTGFYERHALGKEKVTGYFSDTFNGRPRLLSVDSNPNAAAIVACHS